MLPTCQEQRAEGKSRGGEGRKGPSDVQPQRKCHGEFDGFRRVEGVGLIGIVGEIDWPCGFVAGRGIEAKIK